MRVLYLSADLGIPVLGGKGGAVHIRSMISAFSRAHHDVLLVAPSLNKSPWEDVADLESRVLHIPPNDEIKDVALALKSFNLGIEGDAHSLSGQVRRILYNQQLQSRLVRKFDSHPPDLIYERCSMFSTAGVILARETARPLIVELNAPLAREQAEYRGSALNSLAAEAEKWTLTRADSVVAVSEPVRDYAISIGVDPSRVHVVPNGVDTKFFHAERTSAEADRERWGIGDGPVIGFVGGLKPWHGVEALPELLAELRSEFPDLQLVIAGEGPMRRQLESRFETLALSDNVVFTGLVPHDQVPTLIRLFDVAVAPYPELNHDFYFSPLKLFEYMACGVAVTAPAVGQIANVIHDQKNGLLYRPDDDLGLATCCRKLLRDRSLRSSLGSAAAAYISRNFTWDLNAKRVVDIAAELASLGGVAV